MMGQNVMEKWEGKVCAAVKSKNADQIWSLFKDFFNIHKWFPGLVTCYGIHGTNGEVGCIRYCSGFSIPSTDGNVAWSKERLAAIDHIERSMSYGILESNIGLESYNATFKIVPLKEEDGCVVEWSFNLDPVRGWRLEEMIEKYEMALLAIAERMEDC